MVADRECGGARARVVMTVREHHEAVLQAAMTDDIDSQQRHQHNTNHQHRRGDGDPVGLRYRCKEMTIRALMPDFFGFEKKLQFKLLFSYKNLNSKII